MLRKVAESAGEGGKIITGNAPLLWGSNEEGSASICVVGGFFAAESGAGFPQEGSGGVLHAGGGTIRGKNIAAVTGTIRSINRVLSSGGKSGGKSAVVGSNSVTSVVVAQ